MSSAVLMYSILFGLPQHLVSVLLVEWIDVKSIIRLDSACCSRADRNVLLETMRSPQNLFISDDSIYDEQFRAIQWTLRRSLKVSSVHIIYRYDVPFDLNTFSRYLSLCGPNLQELTILSADKRCTKLSLLLQEVVLYAPAVKSLKLTALHLSDDALHLLRKLNNLQNLHIMDGRPMTALEVGAASQSSQMESLSPQTPVHEQLHSTPWPNLRSLVLTDWFLQRSNLTESLFRSLLIKSRCVTHLALSWIEGLDYRLISKFCPNLQSLTVSNTDFGARNMIEMSEMCPKINTLCLNYYWCGGDSAACQALFQNWRLQTLSLNYSDINDTVISYIGTYLHNTLTCLYICGVTGHSEMSVYWKVFRQCGLLHTLAINVSDLLDLYINSEEYDTLASITTLLLTTPAGHMMDCTAVSCIHVLCPNVRTLYMYSDRGAIMTELIDTVKHCTQLRKLYVQKISDSALRAMRKINPHLLVHAVKEPVWFPFIV